MGKILKYGSNLALIAIIVILIIPSWRISFQGWFQSVFMGHLVLEYAMEEPLPNDVKNWEIVDLSGKTISFESFQGKPTILSFWATWCPPCRSELSELNKLKEKWENRINIVSVSEESNDIILKSGLQEDYNFLYSTNRFPSFFDVSLYPTLCILSSELNLVYSHGGAGKLNSEKNDLFLKSLIENK